MMGLWALVFASSLVLTSAVDERLKSLAEANNQLAHELHRLLGTEDDGNIFISPMSIATALAMLMRGARGDTQEELHRYLGFDDAGLTQNEVHSTFQQLLKQLNSDNDDYQLYMANAVLAQKDFAINDQYKNDLKLFYQSKVQNVDFKGHSSEAVDSINEWVNENTRGKIKTLVKSLDPDTVLVLLNAIYFKGTWEKEFDPKETRSLAFHNHGQHQNQKMVHMMQREDTFLHAELTGVTAIELPYEGKDISMVILIPDELNGIAKLESVLRPKMVTDIRKLMQKTKLTLFLPKFKVEYEKGLSETLKKVGIKKVFQRDADLSGISASEALQVTQVRHKAVIEVNEQGSEAAGTTDIELINRMLIIGKKTVLVDHPFLFALVDVKTNMILFQGRISEL